MAKTPGESFGHLRIFPMKSHLPQLDAARADPRAGNTGTCPQSASPLTTHFRTGAGVRSTRGRCGRHADRPLLAEGDTDNRPNERAHWQRLFRTTVGATQREKTKT